MKHLRWCAAPAALAALAGWTIPAAAEPAERDREHEAERLFDEARTLQRQGRREDACARFEASDRLDPAVGTLLNLAECAEHAGAIATAWHRYRQAAELAGKRGDSERQALATRKAEIVEARLSRLVIRTPAPLPASSTVWRDDEVVLPSELGVPLPVDPGPHRLTVRAPGYVAWTRAIAIDRGPTTLEIELPPLVPSPAPAARASDPLTAPAAAAPRERPPAPAVRILPLVVGAAGVATLAAGSWFALRARSMWQEVDARCPGGTCPDARTVAAYGPDQQSAAHAATIGTALLVTGGVAVLVAAGLYAFGGDLRF